MTTATTCDQCGYDSNRYTVEEDGGGAARVLDRGAVIATYGPHRGGETFAGAHADDLDDAAWDKHLAHLEDSLPSHRHAVLAAEDAEVARQEARVDTKAALVAGVAGTLSTLAVAGAGAVGVIGSHLGWWALPLVLALGVAATYWGTAFVVLCQKIIRPDLTDPSPGSFARDNHVDELRQMTLTHYYVSKISRLGPLVHTRYRHIAQATDLLLRGLVPLAIGVVLAAVLALLTTAQLM
ncbi:hypothetical protein [Kutzneria buriramensis]|uniref:Pycsar effector protein domain-containing protein n=1 Tax=Kutzneria buriramensis TaxID=1045776 RepID=A0A3E0G5S7_9PSEU|nr:hypothetical protein [Kutzneria buriramensis]REH18299.1 hypothetical protein BCF44_13654 [Kutzneria buriramensis]